MTSPLDPIYSELSLRMAEEYDSRLRCAIDRALGRTDWTPEELHGRLCRVFQGSREITTLDDVPIFEVLPVEAGVDCSGHVYRAFAFRKYRALV